MPVKFFFTHTMRTDFSRSRLLRTRRTAPCYFVSVTMVRQRVFFLCLPFPAAFCCLPHYLLVHWILDVAFLLHTAVHTPHARLPRHRRMRGSSFRTRGTTTTCRHYRYLPPPAVATARRFYRLPHFRPAAHHLPPFYSLLRLLAHHRVTTALPSPPFSTNTTGLFYVSHSFLTCVPGSDYLFTRAPHLYSFSAFPHT